jgi:hypothetical protein
MEVEQGKSICLTLKLEVNNTTQASLSNLLQQLLPACGVPNVPQTSQNVRQFLEELFLSV